MRHLQLSLPLLALAFVVAEPALAEEAAVVASSQRPFQEAARAAVAELEGAGRLHDANALRSDGSRLASSAVVISIGPLAGGSVARALPADARVVAVLTPRLMGLPPNRTVLVPLDPSAEDVLEVTQRTLPNARRVGVLVGKAGPSQAELQRISGRLGLTLVFSRRDEPVSTALDRMLPTVDVLWVDRSHPAVSDPESMRLVLSRSADAGRPVVGSSKTHVLAGALLAVVPDPARHGQVAGQLARRLLAGEDVRETPPPPGTVLFDGVTARRYGARLPADLKARAESVR